MTALVLLVGFAAVWAAGAGLCAVLLLRSRGNDGGLSALALGSGWFVGTFLLTLWMRLLSAMHVPFGILAIGAPFAILIVVVALWCRRNLVKFRDGRLAVLTGAMLPRWQRILWAVVLAWLAVRFALLLCDIVWRPLYPWDAWTQWSTKARVWFALRNMAPFVTAPEWLQAGTANVYFDAAPHYPATVPLLQVWAAILIGRWDDTLVNLPWWLTGIAFAFAIYGFLAQEGFPPLFALIGTWLVLSLPILDVHVALAGYADLAMSTYLTLAALFALRSIASRHWGDILIALTLLAACTLIKNPGKVWILTLVPGLLSAAWPAARKRIAILSLAGATGVMLILAQTEPVVLGYRLHLDFDMPWIALADAYFAFGNWHLLWYGCLAIALVAWRHMFSAAVAPYSLFVAAGLLFLMFGFGFTNARAWVEDQSTVNRATLHLAPLVIVWMLMTFRAWTEATSKTGLADPTSEPVGASG